MSWADRMARASIRGFEFLTDSHDTQGGRRLVVHEYPGADVPDVEDLGAKADGWKLNAYFIGKDYDLERNGLLVKLNEAGATWLRHPWLGLLWVRVQSWSVHDSTDKGGYGTVAIDFIPGGATVQPTPDRVDVAVSRTSALADAAVDDYAPKTLSADSMTAFVAAVQGKLDTLRTALSLATLPLTWANQVKGLIDSAKTEAAALMAVPGAYAAMVRSLTDALGAGADDNDVDDTQRPRVVARLASLATAASTTQLSGAALSDGALRSNLQQEAALRSRLLATAAAQVALTDYQAEGDRDAALASVTTALDALLPSAADDVFEAVVAARAAVTAALQAQDLKPAVVRDVAAPVPAAVLAHRLGLLEDALLARNAASGAARHPLFMRGQING